MVGEAVRREALLERLARVDPRVVAIIAPAGFGKTSLIRQYLAERGGGVVCDCGRVRDDLDLARRLMPALAAADPARAGDLTRRELLLGDGGTSIADRVALALEAWREPSQDCIVFESAEDLLAAPSARDLLARMLEVRPPGRTVVICSREPLRIHVARYAVPHEIFSLRAPDLAFDANDIRNIFAPYDVDERGLERIVHVSRGWPIAVFLLRRFAGEGRIGTLLERLDDVAFDELHDYLADEVLAGLPAPMLRALFACAAIPQANAEDLRAALDDPAIVDELAELAKETAFVERSDAGVFSLHPLLAALLLERGDERRHALLRTLAGEYERRGDHQRAAELHLARGDQQAAAHALAAYEVARDPAPSMRYARVLSGLDRNLVARYPRLWGVTALMRMFCVDSSALLDEAETVWRTLSPDTSAMERYYVFAFRIVLMSYIGRIDEALLAIDEFGVHTGFTDPPKSTLDAQVLYLRGLLRARRGNFDLAERDLNAALPLVDVMDVTASGTYLALGADIARVRGEWSLERQFLARAHDRAVSSGLANFIAFDTAESLIAAWFSGDRAAFNAIASELESTVAHNGIAGFAYLAGVARGRHVAPTAVDLPKFVVFGHLIALSRSRDESERAALARAALELATRIRVPFVEALAAIALALSDSASFDAAAESALASAARCDAPAFIHAVDAFRNQHENVGMLSSFIEQITRDRSEAAPLAIEVLAGRVRVEGRSVHLPGRESELLAALAQRRDPTPRTRLAAMLWPDLDEFASRNALSVCLHRLRSHLGRDDLVERDGDGYRLHAGAFVDLWEIDRAVMAMRARDRLRETDRAALLRAWVRLCEERAGSLERWEWFEPVARRFDDLRTALAHRLANDALDRGDPDAALEFASKVIGDDPCDETAREIAIRAHLAAGDRAAALRNYRQYRDILRTELQVEPSAALAALVAGG
ncbi:MAG TPA: BTAD domain-containing putative transcriptional regulator [Candidatus Baltobacteraceae bacterium]|nr:BTAD domain-containing putative transcriptional regulator [Candidatus Baltobacteraceae bacterium]